MIAMLRSSKCKQCGRKEHGLVIGMRDQESDTLSKESWKGRADPGCVEPKPKHKERDHAPEERVHLRLGIGDGFPDARSKRRREDVKLMSM
jgi:hypothetical protein